MCFKSSISVHSEPSTDILAFVVHMLYAGAYSMAVSQLPGCRRRAEEPT